ncbi:hypothetical protein CPB86DRAFT_743373 [Serendipita vermifera]|nr:hypothetical protein CPB86DRAFT_743373 [Serendipita vermifera]
MKTATGGLQRSCTATVEATQPFLVGDERIVLLDTPGFGNSTRISDEDILEAVVEYVQKYKANKLLDGIIYLQDIYERRRGEANPNLISFEKLCGNICPSPVVLVTTMWDSIDLQAGIAREKELKEDNECWAPALKRGARIQRHSGTKETAERAILSLFSAQPITQPTSRSGSPPDTQGHHLIAVMGPTGSGKTSFINLASGSDLEVGNGLKSCTTNVKATAPFQVSGQSVILFDTPGFENTKTSDFNILKDISMYMARIYKEGKRLDGVLYFHPVADTRAAGVTVRNFKLFQGLCGDDALSSVTIVTNMWGLLPSRELGEARELELKTDPDFFLPAVEKGAQFMRHVDSRESSHNIIQSLLTGNHMKLAIQTQMVDERLRLGKTSAVAELTSSFDAAIRNLKRTIERDERAMKGMDSHDRREMQATIKEIKGQIQEFEEYKARAQKDRSSFATSTPFISWVKSTVLP